jgi:hypothetical protein
MESLASGRSFSRKGTLIPCSVFYSYGIMTPILEKEKQDEGCRRAKSRPEGTGRGK